MITYAIIEKMGKEVEAFELNKNLFWEELPLQRDGQPLAQGIWAVTRGGTGATIAQGINQQTVVDFYIADANKAKTEDAAAKIAFWIRKNNGICKLTGTLGGVNYGYENIRVWLTSTPQNQGTTPNGAIVKMVSARVVFDIIK